MMSQEYMTNELDKQKKTKGASREIIYLLKLADKVIEINMINLQTKSEEVNK